MEHCFELGRVIAGLRIARRAATTGAVEYPEENAPNIYTDGSMLSGPRRGGAAILFVLVDDHGNEEQREEVLTGYAGATQNQMELEAPVQALKMTTGRHPPFEPARYRKIVIKTDATYVAENFGTAVAVWSRNGWKTREGKPVDNAPQWKELVRLAVLSSKQAPPSRRTTGSLKWCPALRDARRRGARGRVRSSLGDVLT